MTLAYIIYAFIARTIRASCAYIAINSSRSGAHACTAHTVVYILLKTNNSAEHCKLILHSCACARARVRVFLRVCDVRSGYMCTIRSVLLWRWCALHAGTSARARFILCARASQRTWSAAPQRDVAPFGVRVPNGAAVVQVRRALGTNVHKIQTRASIYSTSFSRLIFAYFIIFLFILIFRILKNKYKFMEVI